MPPSANQLFRNVTARDGKPRGRVPTQRYLVWRRAAMNEAMAQRQEPIKGPVKVKIEVGRPDKRKRDISNLIKAVEDLIVTMGLIEDDSLVQCLQIKWGGEAGARVEIRSV